MKTVMAQKSVVAGVWLVVLMLVGMKSAPKPDLPDAAVLSAGSGMFRGVPDATIPAHMHSLEGVARQEVTLSGHPDLEASFWKHETSSLGDGGGGDFVMPEEEAAINPATLNGAKPEDRGLNAQMRSSSGFLKQSEDSLRKGLLSGKASASESGSDLPRDRSSVFSSLDAGMNGDRLSDANSDGSFSSLLNDSTHQDDTSDGQADSYGGYLYDKIGDGSSSVGFDSLEGMESYTPKTK